MTPAFVNLNGRILAPAEARVGILDHGLLYGDGVFETLRVSEGRIFRPEAHLARLAESCARLALPLPASSEELLAALESVVAANALHEGALRLTVTRGEGPPFPDPTACPVPAFFVTARASKPAEGTTGTPPVWTAWVTGTHPRTFIPGIKSLSYLPFQQARVEARRHGADEAILTWGNHVVEAGTSNLFVVLDGRLWTPDLESGCLPGLARSILLEFARAVGLTPHEAPLPLDCFTAASEVIASNSLMGAVAVVRIDGRPVGRGGPGPASARLFELYSDLVRSVCKG